jgi:hypothetical protein
MTLSTRIEKLERRQGPDEETRWLRSLSDEELEAQLAELYRQIRMDLAGRGIDCAGLSDHDVAARLEAELNQEISA